MRANTTLVLFAVGAVWGSSFLFIKVIVEEISPLELVVGRLLIGTLTVGLLLAGQRVSLRRSPSLLAKVAVLALASNVAPFALIAWAEVHIESGVAAVLNSAMPLFTALFAAAVLAEERFTSARVAGLVTGFVGVGVLTGREALHLTDSGALGQLAVLAASACYGAGGVYTRTLLRTEDPLTLSGLQLVLATILSVPIALLVEGAPDYALSTKGWLALLGLGMLGTGVAYVAYIWLVDSVGSVRASLVTYIIPIVGLLLGWMVLDERIGINTAVGTALIIVGVATVLRGQAPSSQRAVSAPATGGD